MNHSLSDLAASQPPGPARFRPQVQNIYLPEQAVIRKVIRENSLVKTFVLEFADLFAGRDFTFIPGQFMMVSIPHCGEAPISISSPPGTGGGRFHLTVRRAGRLTTAMLELAPGDTICVRGPYGNGFPVQELEGRDLLFVAGGIGMAPLRSMLEHCLANRDRYGTMTLCYGARTVADLCFRDDIPRWQDALHCLLSVDRADEDWSGHQGLVTELLDQLPLPGPDARALVCGPGVMIRFVLRKLSSLGYPPQHLVTTLERHMKCGVGICGHCHFQGQLICREGPVFTLDQIEDLDSL